MKASRGRGSIPPNHSWPCHYMGMSGQCHALVTLYPWKNTPSTNWIGGWVGLRAGLDTEARGKVLCLCQGSNPGHPVCSQTLYSLSYPSHKVVKNCHSITASYLDDPNFESQLHDRLLWVVMSLFPLIFWDKWRSSILKYAMTISLHIFPNS
jgi:hypothetical protein